MNVWNFCFLQLKKNWFIFITFMFLCLNDEIEQKGSDRSMQALF